LFLCYPSGETWFLSLKELKASEIFSRRFKTKEHVEFDSSVNSNEWPKESAKPFSNAYSAFEGYE